MSHDHFTLVIPGRLLRVLGLLILFAGLMLAFAVAASMGNGFDHSSTDFPLTGSHKQVACSRCHEGGIFTGIPNTCFACHSQVGRIKAIPKNTTHIRSNDTCNDCHTTAGWMPAHFTHTSPNYPGEHRREITCSQCHQKNSEVVTWRSGYQPDCAGCHAANYRTSSHKKSESPRTFYTVSELRDCSGPCHMYTDSTFTTILRTRNGEHRVNGGGF